MMPVLLNSIINNDREIPDGKLSILNSDRTIKSSEIDSEDLIRLIYSEDTGIDSHMNNKIIHITNDERKKWNLASEHISNTVIHITREERDAWNAKENKTDSEDKYNAVINLINSHTKKEDFATRLHLTASDRLYISKVEQLVSDVSAAMTAAVKNISWKEPVQKKSDIDTTYPITPHRDENGEESTDYAIGWTVYVIEDRDSYTYSGSEAGWVLTGSDESVNPVTNNHNGLMTPTLLEKLNGIEEGANNYIHPDTEIMRHVTDVEKARWNNKADHKAVDANSAGLMTPQMYVQLTSLYDAYKDNRIYEHPLYHSADMIISGEKNVVVTKQDRERWNSKANDVVANGNTNGLMSSTMYAKLNGIDEGANKYTHPETHPASMITQDNQHMFVTKEQKEKIESLMEADAALISAFSDDSSIATVKSTAPIYIHPASHPASMIEQSDDRLFVTSEEKTKWNNKADAIVATKTTNGLMSIEHVARLENAVMKEDLPIMPTSLPANGGDADSVGGYSAKDIIAESKRGYVVIGNNSVNAECDCDFLYDGTNLADVLNDAIMRTDPRFGGEIRILPGLYTYNSDEEQIELDLTRIKLSGIGLVQIKDLAMGNNEEVKETIPTTLYNFSDWRFRPFTDASQSINGTTYNNVTFIKTTSGVKRLPSPNGVMIDGIKFSSYVELSASVGSVVTNTIRFRVEDPNQEIRVYLNGNTKKVYLKGTSSLIEREVEQNKDTFISIKVEEEGLYDLTVDSLTKIYGIFLVGSGFTINEKEILSDNHKFVIAGSDATIENIEFYINHGVKITANGTKMNNCTFSGYGLSLFANSCSISDCLFSCVDIGIKIASDEYKKYIYTNDISHCNFVENEVGIYIANGNINRMFIHDNHFNKDNVGIMKMEQAGVQCIINNYFNLPDLGRNIVEYGEAASQIANNFDIYI